MELDATQKKVLKIAGLGCGAAALLLAVATFFLIRTYVMPELQRRSIESPDDVGPVGVSVGKGLLKQSIFFEDKKLGLIGGVEFGKLDPDPNVAAIVTGSARADLVSAQGKLLRTQRFPPSTAVSYPYRLDVDGDGSYEWVGTGEGEKGESLRVVSGSGKLIWEYSDPDLEAMGWTVGHLRNEKEWDFVLRGARGLDLVDARGRRVWHREDRNVWHVVIRDLDGDGKREIVHSNGDGELVIRDAQGRVKSSRHLSGSGRFPHDLGNFFVTRWVGSKKRGVLYPTDKDFRIADSEGRSVAILPAPVAYRRCCAHGLPVKLWADRSEYFAVLAAFSDARRSVLYLYDSQKRLVYMEVLPEEAHFLCPRPLPGTSAEALVIGGDGRVLQYAAAASAAGRAVASQRHK